MADDAWTFIKSKERLVRQQKIRKNFWHYRTWVTGRTQRRSQHMVLHQSSTAWLQLWCCIAYIEHLLAWRVDFLSYTSWQGLHQWLSCHWFSPGFQRFSVNSCNQLQKLICHWVEVGASQVPLLLAFLNPKQACWNDLDLSWGGWMLFVTDPQGREKDYIVVPAEWNCEGLGRNLGFQCSQTYLSVRESDW